MAPSTSKLVSPPRRPRTFTMFSTLPPELRQKIWFFALPGPRHLEITDYFEGFPNSCLAPSMLNVNREARQIFLKHYHRRVWELPSPLHLILNLKKTELPKFHHLQVHKTKEGYVAFVSHVAVWIAVQKDFDFFECKMFLPSPYSTDI